MNTVICCSKIAQMTHLDILREKIFHDLNLEVGGNIIGSY